MVSKWLFCCHIARNLTHITARMVFVKSFKSHYNNRTDNEAKRNSVRKWLHDKADVWNNEQGRICHWSFYTCLTNRWACSHQWQISLRSLICIPSIALCQVITVYYFSTRPWIICVTFQNFSSSVCFFIQGSFLLRKSMCNLHKEKKRNILFLV